MLRYETCTPFKTLSATVKITNQSQAEHIIELAIDTATLKIRHSHLRDQSVTFSSECTRNSNQDEVVNAEVAAKCWFIENPMSKELTKRITLKLGATATQDF